MERPRFLTRGWRLALTVAALAAVAAPAATSRPSRQSVNEVLKVEFGIGYEVTATIRQGDPNAECGGWREIKLTDEVDAGSGEPAPSKVDTIQGSFSDYTVLPAKIRKQMMRASPWVGYNFTAVGAAHGTVLRRRVESGEDFDCSSGSPVAKPFTPPPNDCGKRSFNTPAATLMAGRRQFDGTLKSLMVEKGQDSSSSRAIGFQLAPTRPLYRSCDLAELGVPEYPTGVGLLLPSTFPLGFVRRIAELKIRGVAVYGHEYAGQCDPTVDASDRCTYHLDLHVHILRTS